MLTLGLAASVLACVLATVSAPKIDFPLQLGACFAAVAIPLLFATYIRFYAGHGDGPLTLFLLVLGGVTGLVTIGASLYHVAPAAIAPAGVAVFVAGLVVIKTDTK
jgi:hypothetical protein